MFRLGSVPVVCEMVTWTAGWRVEDVLLSFGPTALKVVLKRHTFGLMGTNDSKKGCNAHRSRNVGAYTRWSKGGGWGPCAPSFLCHVAVNPDKVTDKKKKMHVCVGCGRSSCQHIIIEIEAGLGTHGHLPRTCLPYPWFGWKRRGYIYTPFDHFLKVLMD